MPGDILGIGYYILGTKCKTVTEKMEKSTDNNRQGRINYCWYYYNFLFKTNIKETSNVSQLVNST